LKINKKIIYCLLLQLLALVLYCITCVAIKIWISVYELDHLKSNYWRMLFFHQLDFSLRILTYEK